MVKRADINTFLIDALNYMPMVFIRKSTYVLCETYDTVGALMFVTSTKQHFCNKLKCFCKYKCSKISDIEKIVMLIFVTALVSL